MPTLLVRNPDNRARDEIVAELEAWCRGQIGTACRWQVEEGGEEGEIDPEGGPLPEYW